ncbi:MAG: hypothetical protein CMO81_00440 [Waddliaceae bacterium]|nr:hypothetical protein [Waddliaceae bacterium]
MWKNNQDERNNIFIVEDSLGNAFAASSVSEWILDKNNYNLGIAQKTGDLPQFWDSSETYLELLDFLIEAAISEETKGQLKDLKKQAILSIEVLSNLQNQNSFLDILSSLHKGFVGGTVGASYFAGRQEISIKQYYQIRDRLPDDLRIFLLPGHIFHPGDPYCVNSARKILQKQIDRLALFCSISPKELGFYDESLLTEKVEGLLNALSESYPQDVSLVAKRKLDFTCLSSDDWVENEAILKVPVLTTERNCVILYYSAKELFIADGNENFKRTLLAFIDVLLNNGLLSSELEMIRKDCRKDIEFYKKLDEKVKEKISHHYDEEFSQRIVRSVLRDLIKLDSKNLTDILINSFSENNDLIEEFNYLKENMRESFSSKELVSRFNFYANKPLVLVNVLNNLEYLSKDSYLKFYFYSIGLEERQFCSLIRNERNELVLGLDNKGFDPLIFYYQYDNDIQDYRFSLLSIDF